jgi:hypothetical protein
MIVPGIINVSGDFHSDEHVCVGSIAQNIQQAFKNMYDAAYGDTDCNASTWEAEAGGS